MESGTRTSKVRPVLLVWLMLAGAWVHADLSPGQPAIDGYSPVSYFTEGQAERGQPEHAVTHDGQTYFLTSETQVREFEADPERYIPAYGAYCPYSLALGRREPIDPTNFKVVGDQLLLFHRSESMDGRAAFEADDRQQELLERAEREYTLIRF